MNFEWIPLDHGVGTFSMCCWTQFVNILLKIFESIFIKALTRNLLYRWHLIWFWYRMIVASQNVLGVFTPLFWKSLKRNSFSLYVWSYLPVKPSGPGFLLFLNYSFNLSTCEWSVHIFCFILVQSWEIIPFFTNLSISSKLPILLACSLLWSFVIL